MTINEFLKNIANDIITNNKNYTADDFYYTLKYTGVDKDTKFSQDIDKFYKDFLDNLNNSLVKFQTKTVKEGENATHYIGFYVDKKADYKEAIKVYFPVKYEYMISALKTTFLYLIRNNIKSVVKFHVKETNEGIVIKFYNEEDALPFINYCNNNFMLKDLLVSVNPFIPTIHKIGVIRDDNTNQTFIETLSNMLYEYFYLYKVNNKLEFVSELDFLDFVINKKNNPENAKIRFNLESIEKSIISILNGVSPI